MMYLCNDVSYVSTYVMPVAVLLRTDRPTVVILIGDVINIIQCLVLAEMKGCQVGK